MITISIGYVAKIKLNQYPLQYFGYDNKPRKTLAQHWLQTLEPMVPTSHQKINYQSAPNMYFKHAPTHQ